MLRRNRFGMREVMYVAACTLIIAAGVGAYAFTNTVTNTEVYEDLVGKVQTIAALIDPRLVENLSVSATDLVNPDYIRLKEHITNARTANPDLRFVYLMALRDGRVYFMVDSEDPSSEDYSPPGQEYEEASAELMTIWAPNTPYVLEIAEDRWGNWISALAPIRNENGDTIALVGIDQNADAHRIRFLAQAGLVTLATIALLSLVTLSYVLSRREQDLINMKTDFVAVASHELRTPLMSLRWSLAQMKDDHALDRGVRETLALLHNQVRALIDLTTSFLMTTSADYGLFNTKNHQYFDVAALVRNRAVNATPSAAALRITIENAIVQETRAIVKGDENRLRLVFDNLISNAVKYSRPNSKVTVSYAHKGSSHEFSFQDHGIGIPKKALKSVFAGFNRAANAELSGIAGTGFGLYIAKRIVDFHGGTIRVESEEGSGTTFTVSLPAVESSR